MIIGSALLLLALLALVIAIVTAVFDLVSPEVQKRRLSIRATWAGFGIALFAILVLAGAFLVGDLSIQYVWANSDLRYAWYQRLSGLWVGRAGSLLLWTVIALGVWSAEELRHHLALRRSKEVAVQSAETANGPRRETDPATLDARLAGAERVRRVARPAVLLILTLMMLVVAMDDPFVATDPEFLAMEPWGRGVNPQLIIPLNAIHPPLVFLGYAFTLVPTAFALGHLVTGEKAWLGPARRWAHLAFLFLTIGVGLGGLWAYIALGWGGYWAWDPVEVGSIIPWLMITVFLHAAYRADGKNEFAVAAPAFAFLAFPAAVFSTFVVRAGGVWVSLHSFLGPGAASSAWGRFTAAFAAQPEVKLYTTILVGAILGLVILLYRHVQRIEAHEATAAKPKVREVPDRRWHERLLARVTLGNMFTVGVLLLALLTTVTLTVLIMGVNGFSSDAVRAQVFTERTGPIALSAVTVMALAVSIGTLRKTYVLGLLGGALLVGAVAALLFRDTWALAMATPVLVVIAVLVAMRIVMAWRTRTRRHAVRFTGIHLVHLGIAVLFLGHGFVSTFEEVHPPTQFEVGETKQAGPYLMRLDHLEGTDTDGNRRVDHVLARFHIWEDGKSLGTATASFQYYDFQTHYKPDIGVKKEGIKDIYLAPSGIHDPKQGWLFGNLPLTEQGALEATEVDGFAVQVSTLPFIDLIWVGASLMVLGAALISFSSWTAFRPERAPARAPEGSAGSVQVAPQHDMDAGRRAYE